MKKYEFKDHRISDFREGVTREWVLTNGIGGYAGGSIIGANTRNHHGYLIASLHPPVERFLILSKINETLHCDGETFDLTTTQYADATGATCYHEGNRYLTSFSYDGLVHFQYQAGDITIVKSLMLEHGKNTIAIGYEITNSGAAATLTCTPLFNYRVHHDQSTPKTLRFHSALSGNVASLIPAGNPEVNIRLHASEGHYEKSPQLYDENMQLQTEMNVEASCLDNNYTPYQLHIELPANCHKKVSLICTIEDSCCTDAFATMAQEYDRIHALEQTAGYEADDFASTLVVAADNFLSYRSSTGLKTVLAGLPWFTDWGRDTMIALTGLTLSTERFAEAREILSTFAQYVKKGLVPNMFPDEGAAPLYNTADASLWYFYAVDRYLDYTGTPQDYAFVREKIYPKLIEILHAYKNGTDFSIYMEDDCLIHAGSGLDQVTWMDVRVGDWVATPRHGKPVEINALWYNALCVMDKLSKRFSTESVETASACDLTFDYATLAAKVKSSFNQKFWNEADQCLYDVVDGDIGDATLRPNQIYAISLPNRMLSPAREKAVVDKVYDKLYVGCGLRSVSPDDPQYHPYYKGCLQKRDEAYHQGTAWGFLLGGFVTAYANVYGHEPDAKNRLAELFTDVKSHLSDGCIGSIAEIFDGDAPHTSRGCYAQAWSVGEVLRAYTEHVLKR